MYGLYSYGLARLMPRAIGVCGDQRTRGHAHARSRALTYARAHSRTTRWRGTRDIIMAYVVMAYVVMACVVMAYVVMAYI